MILTLGEKVNINISMKQLIFYGPTGKGLPSEKVGGGEKGCQRTISLYEKLGVQVFTIEKPNLGRGKLAFVYYFIITPFLLITAFLKHPNTPVHITGFYENQLFYEYVIFMVSRLFRRKVVYELRNGTMAKTYQQHSFFYQKAMQYMLVKSSAVLCQGKEFIDFINSRWKVNTIYYPNYIMNSYIRPYDEQRMH